MSVATNTDTSTPAKQPSRWVRALLATLAPLALFAQASPAFAAKQVVDYFGTDPSVISGTLGGQFFIPGATAINQSGAGVADKGDIYVTDRGGGFADKPNRIERFAHDANGTPANPYDDSYEFVSAWGADVVQPGGAGDRGDAAAANYEICTVAAQCKWGVPSAGNGTTEGNGGLVAPDGIAVDQDSGEVYVVDRGNSRINVYEGDGAFLRSVGYDVVASGPGDLPGATETQTLTVRADGGQFSLSFRGETTGAKGTGNVLAGSPVVTGVKTTSGEFAVGQAISANICVPPSTTIAEVGEESLTLSQNGSCGAAANLDADGFAPTVTAAQLETALNALPTIGGIGGSVAVSGGPGNLIGSAPYTITFGGSLGDQDVPALAARSQNLAASSGSASTTVTETAKGGTFEVCAAAQGDVCRGGSSGDGAGEFSDFRLEPNSPFYLPAGVALSPPDGSAATGTVYVADAGNSRIVTFSVDGSAPSSIGSTVFSRLGGGGGWSTPTQVAVDSRGIIYAENRLSSPPGFVYTDQIERYDSQNVNGGGVGFLAPLIRGVNEGQRLTVDASAGQFKLSFGGYTTTDLPSTATSAQVASALAALPSIGAGNVHVAGGSGNPFSLPEDRYDIGFQGTLGGTDVEQLVVSDGAVPLSGGSGASVTTLIDGVSGGPLPSSSFRAPLAVDLDSDGAGPESDVLYVGLGAGLAQFGPLSPPGQSSPPAALDDILGVGQLNTVNGLAVDESTGSAYITATQAAGQNAHGVYVLNVAGGSPSITLDSVSDVAPTSAAIMATVEPNGPPEVSSRLEYSSDGVNWSTGPEITVGHQESPQAVSQTLDPPPFGLQPNTLYHVRAAAIKKFAAPVTSNELTFTTDAQSPQAETSGSPVRTATTARLEGRVGPRNSATSYHFEYGDQGPCATNPCKATPAAPAGSGALLTRVSRLVEGLAAGTTYHYRVVSESAAPGSPVYGADMTVTTRVSDAPLSHGHVPGPSNSDRGWEQVNTPDTGGNPVTSSLGISDDGSQVAYMIPGGTPQSYTGGVFSQFFARRDGDGWKPVDISPPRDQLSGQLWGSPKANGDLTSLVNVNRDKAEKMHASIWRLSPDAAPRKLYEQTGLDGVPVTVASADTERVMLISKESLDPDHPVSPGRDRLFDVSAAGGVLGGPAPMASLLPGDVAPDCGVGGSSSAVAFTPLLSANGSRLFFPSQGDGPCGNGGAASQIYMRDLVTGVTERVSGPALSGPECSATLSLETPAAVFFWTTARLTAADTAKATCSQGGGDIYRYQVASGQLSCLTCGLAGGEADVAFGGLEGVDREIAVADDGSRIYFVSPHALLPGAAPNGTYRLDAASGELAYLGTLNASIGPETRFGAAATPDGSVLIFRSSAATLNPIGGSDNGGTDQYYRYDDDDGSLVCVSCPEDGSAPRGGVGALTAGTGNNSVPLSADGDIFSFATPTPLVGADQNTARKDQDPVVGNDAYEWRDGRTLLLSDGITSWPPGTGFSPVPSGMTPSGRDAYFVAAVQLTPDALDTYPRLYDARIGGGFEFPPPPKPCPLEVCQGTPRGAPQDLSAGTTAYSGPGEIKRKARARRCPKGKRRVRRNGKSRCVKRHAKRRHRSHRRKHPANRHRRTRG